MKNTTLLTTALLLLCSAAFASGRADQFRYVTAYKDLAVSEMLKTGIPASIKLAQGVLESGCGSSKLAVNANNHFGIKCKSDWTGETFYLMDDDKDENDNPVESCFRVYDSALQSYLDHSRFLMENSRYARLFTFGMDYKKWAYGLQECTYATADHYAESLIRIIEENQLYIYDQEAGRIDLETVSVEEIEVIPTVHVGKPRENGGNDSPEGLEASVAVYAEQKSHERSLPKVDLSNYSGFWQEEPKIDPDAEIIPDAELLQVALPAATYRDFRRRE